MKGLTLTAREERRAYVLTGVLDKRWTGKQGAELLGVSDRHLWRMLAAYRERGPAALVHGNRGLQPANATKPEVKASILALAQGKYAGMNDCHLTETLGEREDLQVPRSTLRRFLREAGIKSPKQRRAPRHRSRRARYPEEGMLLQVDGSPHRWLEERGPELTLIGAIDDATGAVPYALFRKQEDTQGYFLLLRGLLERQGIPQALYSDRHSIFQRSARESETLEEQLAGKRRPTQFGDALERLDIQLILAQSPQAKGRIERLWGTLQSRLVAELRLARARTMEEANAVLWRFLPCFNQRFGVPPAQAGSAYRPVQEGMDLDATLCFRYYRKVAKDNTLVWGKRTLQLAPGKERSSYARAVVEVQERLNGQTVVLHKGVVVSTCQTSPVPARLRGQWDRGWSLKDRLGDQEGLQGEESPAPGKEAQGHGGRGTGLGIEDRPDGVGAKSKPTHPALTTPGESTY